MSAVPAIVQADRRRFLGGSDAAAVLGVSPWKTRLALWLEKTGRGPGDRPETVVQARGKALEPYLYRQLELDAGIHLAAHDVRFADAERAYLAAQIDAITLDGLNVEIKTVHPMAARDWGPAGEDAIPVYYTAQAMHGLMVTGARACLVYAAIGFDDRRVYRVERDEETIAALRAQEVEFWESFVLTDIPPPPATGADAALLYAKDAGTSIEADATLVELIDRLRIARARVIESENEADSLMDAVKLIMRDHSTITAAGKPLVTWKTQTARRLDQKALEAAHPGLIDQFKVASESRVFRIR